MNSTMPHVALDLHQRQFTFRIEKPMELGFSDMVIYSSQMEEIANLIGML
jgi:hypothetical protein